MKTRALLQVLSILLISWLAACASQPRPIEVTAATEPAIPLLDLGTEASLRIGFGSCLHQERPQPILDTVRAEDFDLFLFLGDNVYGDVDRGNQTDLGPLRAAYAAQGESEGLRQLRDSTTVLATWDDHDYGLNDAGADFPGRVEAQELFRQFWEVPADHPIASRPGVYQSVFVGPPGRRVQVILLDTRYFRSPLDRDPEKRLEPYRPDPDPSKTMLGGEQWRWLEQQLRQPADLRLLVSSVQVIADGHGWEAWRTLPAERERLYELIRRTGAQGVVILSGDRHRAGIYRHPDAVPYSLLEVTSSSLNLPLPSELPEEAGPYRLGSTYAAENYGSILINWETGTVGLSVRNLEGDVVLAHAVTLDALR